MNNKFLRFRVAIENRSGWIHQCDTEEELWQWVNFIRKPTLLGPHRVALGQTTFVVSEWTPTGAWVRMAGGDVY